jgi:8-oxo-dGTP pyrophosphatase MutT (NUDIX family)
MGVSVLPEGSSVKSADLAADRFSLTRIGDVLRGREARIIDGTAHAAAVALVLRLRAHQLETLLIKRAEHPRDPWSGHMGLPGGRAESHDSSLVHTAIRETEEEIGLTLRSDRDLLGALDETRASARTRSIDMKIAPFVFAVENAPDDLVRSEEVAATHWIPLSELFDSSHASSITLRHAGETLRFPAIELRGLTIWGLTLRMLRNFESVVSLTGRE